MKRAFIFFTGIFFTLLLSAQTPQKMSYQAVVRDAENKLVTNREISMQISILQGSATGTPVYVETLSPKTNANGLVGVEVGTGKSSYKFSGINWGSDLYFIKTEIDLKGGTNYTISGTNQLLSVPYAFYAEKSGSALWGQNSANELYYLGGNVGIGTSNPTYELDIVDAGGEAYGLIRSGYSSASLLIDKNAISHIGQIAYQQNHENIFHTGLLGNNNYRISTDRFSLNGLEVQQSGKVMFSDNFQMSTGAGEGKVMTSDASGNASWQSASGGGGTETKYLSIPGMAFQNFSPVENPTLTEYGNIKAKETTVPDQMEVSYPVILPDGAMITDFEVTLVDYSSGNLKTALYCNEFKSNHTLTTTDTKIFEITSSGSSSYYREFSANLSGIDPMLLTIDKDKVYYIIATWYHEGTGIKMALSRVLITYTE